jgi:spermidine synthase
MADDDVVMRRRDDGALELRVNGVFVMDDVETTSERRLAQIVLDHGARDVLVGGLGLGFTARTLLADDRVRRVVVVDLHPDVVRTVRSPRPGTPAVGKGLVDPRLDVVIGDVRDIVPARPDGCSDAVLLDVDNGPDSLVHAGNTAVYEDAFVAECARVLRPGGTLAVWSMADSPALRATLGTHLSDVDAERVPVRLQGRDDAYWIITARR